MDRIVLKLSRCLILALIPGVALVVWHGTRTAIEVKDVVGQLVILVVLCIASVGLLFVKEIRIRKDFLHGSVAAYGIIMLVSFAMGQRSSINTRAMMPQLCGVLTFFLTAYCFDRRHIKPILSLFTGIGAVTAVYGIIQYAGVDPVDWMIPEYDLRAQMVSTFGQKNFFAIFLLLIIPLGVATSVSSNGAAGKAACTVSTALMVLALMLSYSRGGVLTLFIVLVAIGALYVLKRMRNRTGFRHIGWLLLILPVVMIGVLFILPEHIRKDFSKLDQGALVRLEWYRGTGEIIQRHPLRGVGPGNFAIEYVQNRTHKSFAHNPNQVLSHAHNEFLETWVEYGLMGFLALCAVWVGLLYKLVVALLNTRDGRQQIQFFLSAGIDFGVSDLWPIHGGHPVCILHLFLLAHCRSRFSCYRESGGNRPGHQTTQKAGCASLYSRSDRNGTPFSVRLGNPVGGAQLPVGYPPEESVHPHIKASIRYRPKAPRQRRRPSTEID